MDNFNNILSQEFYNTIYLDAESWAEENKKSKGLQQHIKFILQQNKTLLISAWLMKRYLEKVTGSNKNINSVRRCLSNLKNEDTLLILTGTRIGEENKAEHYYIWKEGNEHRNDIKKDKFETLTLAQIATNITDIGNG